MKIENGGQTERMGGNKIEEITITPSTGRSFEL